MRTRFSTFVDVGRIEEMTSFHIELNEIEEYLRYKRYPPRMSANKGSKANFRRACRYFTCINGHVTYKEKRLVIQSKEQQLNIIHEVHKGMGADPRAQASHRGRETTYQKCSERFLLLKFYDDLFG